MLNVFQHVMYGFQLVQCQLAIVFDLQQYRINDIALIVGQYINHFAFGLGLIHQRPHGFQYIQLFVAGALELIPGQNFIHGVQVMLAALANAFLRLLAVQRISIF